MPNWCLNYVTLTHDDPAVIAQAADAFKRGALLQELLPISEDDDAESRWGTKWDIGGEDDADVSGDGRTLILAFTTAWRPPLSAYRELGRIGFKVHADYCEYGNAFCGLFSTDEGEAEYNFWNGEIPGDLDEKYGISNYTGRNSGEGEAGDASQGEKVSMAGQSALIQRLAAEAVLSRMRLEIEADMQSGRVPRSVRSFPELHDYVDANCYGGMCDTEYSNFIEDILGGNEKLIEFLNRCQNEVGGWLSTGWFSEGPSASNTEKMKG